MSIRRFMDIITESYEDYDDEDEYAPPKPQEYILKAGTTIYHGTNGDFEERHGLNNPSWVTDSEQTARYFAKWKQDEGHPRISVWTVKRDTRLAIVDSEYFDYCNDELCYEDPEDILNHLRREGFEGWIIPDNYGTSQADILLGEPDVLDYVKSVRL